jgi:hypothetical protein
VNLYSTLTWNSPSIVLVSTEQWNMILRPRSSYTTAQDVLSSGNCRTANNDVYQRWLGYPSSSWKSPCCCGLSAWRCTAAATCCEQPVPGAHLGSPWLLGFPRCTRRSCYFLLARCWNHQLQAPIALQCLTSPTYIKIEKALLFHLLAKCCAMPNAFTCGIPWSLRMLFSKNHDKNHLQIRQLCLWMNAQWINGCLATISLCTRIADGQSNNTCMVRFHVSLFEVYSHVYG